MIHGPALAADRPGLLTMLARHAADAPDDEAIRFLQRGQDRGMSIKRAALVADMEEIAAGLVERRLSGRAILLALPPGIRFVTAFLACLRAGAVAVPAVYPATGHAADRLKAMLDDARPAAIITDDAGAFSGRPVLTLECLREAGVLPELAAASAPAMIQYSSGSTRRPAGIVITHGNLAANLEMIRQAFGLAPGEVGVNWLPPSHDMGLVGSILAPLFSGVPTVLMPPTSFLQKPVRWLQAIDEYGGTIAGGPNFGYELCTRRVAPEAALELDLTRWRVAFCGAEPVRAATLAGFSDHFAVSGFDPAAFLPCYGMAESTLLSTSGSLHEIEDSDSGRSTSRVSCGRPAPGCTITLRGGEYGPDRGEICLSGPHISPGLWSGQDQTITPHPGVFADTQGRLFLPTGDIGLITGGELAIIDRIKDIIALHGRNIHAIDIETAILDAKGELVTAAAAFPIERNNTETLVAICELSRHDMARTDHNTLKTALRAAIAAATGLTAEIEFLRQGQLPRTSSGKIRRQAARAGYLAKTDAEAANLPVEA